MISDLELDDTLPNGLHDAYLTGLAICFDSGTDTLNVNVLVTEWGEKTRHKNAAIHLSGLVAFVLEGPEVLPKISGPLGFSSFETSEQHYPSLSQFPQEIRKLFHSLYVEEPWNSFIHIAAASAELVWGAESQAP